MSLQIYKLNFVRNITLRRVFILKSADFRKPEAWK